jgi:4-hydroxybenzoate polyprenyltransferase
MGTSPVYDMCKPKRTGTYSQVSGYRRLTHVLPLHSGAQFSFVVLVAWWINHRKINILAFLLRIASALVGGFNKPFEAFIDLSVVKPLNEPSQERG